MKKYKIILILLNLLLVLAFFHYAISQKETILRDGKLVLLELAPIDPRSLIQGDYMALIYTIGPDILSDEKISRRGYCVVRLDSGNIAKKVRLQPGRTPLHPGEYLIEYTGNRQHIDIGAESFFFQEGQAYKYDSAKYGGVKIDAKGNSVLIGLYDANRQLIQ